MQTRPHSPDRPGAVADVLDTPGPHVARTDLAALSRSAAAVLLFALLTALAGQVRVPLPFTPVPLTLQVLPVLLAGALLGPRRGAASQLAFLAAGAFGLPVFSGGAAGLAWLAGPTGGYLAGFVAGAWLVGALLPREGAPRFGRLLAAMVTGTAAIHVMGVLQLSAVTGEPLARAFQLGSLPFLPGAVLKIVAAASMAAAWTGRRRSAS